MTWAWTRSSQAKFHQIQLLSNIQIDVRSQEILQLVEPAAGGRGPSAVAEVQAARAADYADDSEEAGADAVRRAWEPLFACILADKQSTEFVERFLLEQRQQATVAWDAKWVEAELQRAKRRSGLP